MTEDQAAQLIAAMQQLHTDNQNAAALASAQLGYTMHVHELLCWLVYLVLILGGVAVGLLRPRGT